MQMFSLHVVYPTTAFTCTRNIACASPCTMACRVVSPASLPCLAPAAGAGVTQLLHLSCKWLLCASAAEILNLPFLPRQADCRKAVWPRRVLCNRNNRIVFLHCAAVTLCTLPFDCGARTGRKAQAANLCRESARGFRLSDHRRGFQA